jgi:hypothetical protein
LQVGCVTVVERLQSPRNLHATMKEGPTRQHARRHIGRIAPLAFDCRRDAFRLRGHRNSLLNTGRSAPKSMQGSGPLRRAKAPTRARLAVPLMRVLRDSLKLDAGTADNLDMGNTPLLQRRTPGTRTKRVGA